MEFRFLHVYPDLMNLYGSYANVSVLRRLLERLGHQVSVERIAPGGEAELSGADFLYMGAGTERASLAALEDFRRFAEPLKAAAEEGAVMLFSGTAMELLGRTVTESDGTSRPGMGLAPFTAVRRGQRETGDVYGRTDLFPEPVVGFMNKCAAVSGVETPLLTQVEAGFGNEENCAPEGFHWRNVFASELTGPILVKNPRLLETLAELICRRRGAAWPQEPPGDPWAEQGWKVTEEQLRLRWSLEK